MTIKELINVLLEVSRHSDTLMQYVHVDHYDDIGDDHDRIIRLVKDTVAKFEGVEDDEPRTIWDTIRDEMDESGDDDE